MISFLNLKNNLKVNQYAALCLAGKDRWVRHKALAAIMQTYNIPDDGYCVDSLEDATLKDVEMACCTPAMFCEKKLVSVEDFHFPQGKLFSDAADRLSRLISQCDGSFCLVFLSDEAQGFDKIAGLEIVDCDRLDSGSVTKWIIAYGKKQGVEISPICASKIGEYCLQDMARVENETKKLLDYGEVSVESVESLVHKDTEYAVFNLSKTISAKNTQAALEMYKGLISSGEEARGLFGLLYNTYRRAYYAKVSDLPTDKLAELLSVKPYAAEKAKELAAKYKPMQLKRILDYFSDADEKLKAFLDENDVMTALIMQISAL